MKNKRINNKQAAIKVGATLLAGATVMPMAAFAAVPAGNDTIDTYAKASLTIYKYDLTAAKKGGVTFKDEDKGGVEGHDATGEADAELQNTLAKYAMKDIVFSYAKIGDIHQQKVDGNVKLFYSVDADFAALIGLDNPTTVDDVNCYTSNAIMEKLGAYLQGADNDAKVAAIDKYLDGKTTAMPATDAQGMATKDNIDLGLYLVAETATSKNVSRTVDPFIVSLPMTDVTGEAWNYDVTVYPKDQTDVPTINKVVRQKDVQKAGALDDEKNKYADVTTASEADTLQYRVATKVPSIRTASTFLTKYDVKDELSKGIKYDKDTVPVVSFFATEDEAKQGVGTVLATLTATTDYTVTYNDKDNTMTIVLTADGLKKVNPEIAEDGTFTNRGLSGKYMSVAYEAKVMNADVVLGDQGNDNSATLTWKRTSANDADVETIKDKARVYSYGLDITKTFSDGQGDASEVKFVLQNKTDGKFVKATGTDGVYQVIEDDTLTTKEAASADDSDAVFSPKADGSLKIYGLEADEYELTEIHSAAGYSLLKEPIKIVITSTVDTMTPGQASITGTNAIAFAATKGARASATVDDNAVTMGADAFVTASKNATVPLSVLNNKNTTPALPQTGGYGTMIFSLCGAAVAGSGVYVGVLGKKKKKED